MGSEAVADDQAEGTVPAAAPAGGPPAADPGTVTGESSGASDPADSRRQAPPTEAPAGAIVVEVVTDAYGDGVGHVGEFDDRIAAVEVVPAGGTVTHEPAGAALGITLLALHGGAPSTTVRLFVTVTPTA